MYLTGDYKTAFNKGKQQEVKMRFQHTKALHMDKLEEIEKEEEES